MKKTKGFTLAEVLVGLSIVGIAAALTIPQFVKTIQKVETGPKLSRAVQQFEVSSQDYFNYRTKKDAKASHYTKFSDINDVSLDELATFWGLTPTTNGSSFNINNYKEYAFVPEASILPMAYAMSPQEMEELKCRLDPLCNTNPGEENEEDNELELFKCFNSTTGESCTEGEPGCDCGEDKDDTVNATIGNLCPVGKVRNPITGKCETEIEYKPFEGSGDNESDTEPEPDNPSSKYQAYHSKKGGYDIYFDGDKINTTGKSNNEDIVTSFYLDTNGAKNTPNMKGKDLFKFHLRNDGKLEPEGLKDSGYAKNCADSGVRDGLACTARIVRDGYKIKY